MHAQYRHVIRGLLQSRPRCFERRFIQRQSTAMTRPFIDPNRGIHWLLDWDGTITKRDTLDALVNIAKQAKPMDDIDTTWKQVVQAYISDYEETMGQLIPDGLPSTIFEERKLLKDLEQAEQRSIDRVSASAIFKGVTASDLKTGSERSVQESLVQLRDVNLLLHHIGARRARLVNYLDTVSILSVNWSQTFISRCLGAAQLSTATNVVSYDAFKRGHDSPRESDSAGKGVRVNIYANELQGISASESSTSTGILCAEGYHKIISSNDKLGYLEALREIETYTQKPVPIVYVGDSWTDLECLLAADLGVCIRDEPMGSSQKKLAESLQHTGVECLHISQWADVDEWAVVWARNFEEIRNWAQHLQSQNENKLTQ